MPIYHRHEESQYETEGQEQIGEVVEPAGPAPIPGHEGIKLGQEHDYQN